ncbi:DUF3307 domain-containing protein [Nonomuraea sp. NPDC050202]|uniref:DUF3307 domain-containing protein n=1 Tax=Nonomuraea sp. NPDC050202 TaxID=3155035 RepID=UPI0033C3E6DB
MTLMEAIRSGFSPVAMVVFSSVFVTLYAAHQVGDHWVQTHRQACSKGEHSRAGQRACAWHVLTLTLTKFAALYGLVFVTGLPITFWPLFVGMSVDALSHYYADRRYTLRNLAAKLGKADFYELGDPKASPCGTGAYALDQSWHVGWLFVTSLIIAAGA